MKPEFPQNREVNKRPIWQYILFGIILLLFLGGGFGGGHLWTKSIWTDIVQKKQDSLLDDSQSKQQLLKDSIHFIEQRASNLENAINKLSNENNFLYSELRKKERALRNSVDTSFRNNAKRISDSASRYYQKRSFP